MGGLMQFSRHVSSNGLVCTVLAAAWMSGCGAGDTSDTVATGDDSGSPVASSSGVELSPSVSSADRLRRRHKPDAGAVDAGGTACTPTTCAAQSATCGSISDGCTGTLSCGSCTAPETCGGGGVTSACGAPAPTPDAGGGGASPGLGGPGPRPRRGGGLGQVEAGGVGQGAAAGVGRVAAARVGQV